MRIYDYYEANIWLDTDKKKPLMKKLKEGLDHYINKFGHKPDAIFVLQEEIDKIKGDLKLEGIPIFEDRTSMKSHYWFCIKEEKKSG